MTNLKNYTIIFRSYIPFFNRVREITMVNEENKRIYYLDGDVVNSRFKRILISIWVKYKRKQFKILEAKRPSEITYIHNLEC